MAGQSDLQPDLQGMTAHNLSRLTSTLGPMPPLSVLEPQWRELESRADCSFFLTWSWIGTWLNALPEGMAPRLLKACSGEQVMGLAIVMEGPVRRRLGMPVCRTWYLHATGLPELDSLTIEHNGLLVDRSHQAQVCPSMMSAWLDQAGGSAELSLSGLRPGQLNEATLGAARRNARWDEWVRRSYAMDLCKVRDAKGDALAQLSSNTRSQIRRSIKEYGTLGPVTLQASGSVEETLAWMDDLARLHQAHWTSKGQPGAFSSAFFVEFHRALVREAYPRGEIQLLRLTAGDQIVAYLYSFVYRGRVYFYQNGMDYGLIERHARPGLVAHVHAAQYNAAQGHDVYDFMAGDSRYKTTLSNLDEQLIWATVRTTSLRLGAEAALKRWRDARQSGSVKEVELADAGE
jgi:CelD/BcsL family acetyltransferase involved in cellulose biosynthesis